MNDMPVTLKHFSDISTRSDASDNDVVRLDSRGLLKLDQRRFRAVRVATKDARHHKNQLTVHAFISALEQHYGKTVTDQMDLNALRTLQIKGKSLRVRDVKVVIGQSEEIRSKEESVGKSIAEVEAARMDPPSGADLADQMQTRPGIGLPEEPLLRRTPAREETRQAPPAVKESNLQSARRRHEEKTTRTKQRIGQVKRAKRFRRIGSGLQTFALKFKNSFLTLENFLLKIFSRT